VIFDFFLENSKHQIFLILVVAPPPLSPTYIPNRNCKIPLIEGVCSDSASGDRPQLQKTIPSLPVFRDEAADRIRIKIVRRHSLDRLNASRVKQKKKRCPLSVLEELSKEDSRVRAVTPNFWGSIDCC